MTDIGPHLLGRIPSPRDDRDFELIHWLVPNSLDAALAEVLASPAVAPATKDAFRVVIPAIKALQPVPPTPPAPPQPAGVVLWTNPNPVLDQGNFGTCVGNGWANWGNTEPVVDHYDETVARAIYYEATVIDGQPDNPDAPGGGQQGSTVRSGAKAMQNRGRLGTYAFASSVDDAVAWIKTKGPIVMGTDWTSDMFTPDPTGRIHPTGAVMGGHCYVGNGYDPTLNDILFEQSWGTSWGVNGTFRMSIPEFITLFDNQGEACASVELP
jgi:papain like protease